LSLQQRGDLGFVDLDMLAVLQVPFDIAGGEWRARLAALTTQATPAI
jgi:hypothetical protein